MRYRGNGIYQNERTRQPENIMSSPTLSSGRGVKTHFMKVVSSGCHLHCDGSKLRQEEIVKKQRHDYTASTAGG